jgi:hypothetical protein
VKRALCASAAAAGLASAAAAQQQITPGSVAYTLEYDRINSSGTVLGGGPLQVGEIARLRIRMSYAPGFGSSVAWPSNVQAGSSGSGTLAGFWSGNLNISVSGGLTGTWPGLFGHLPMSRQLIYPFNAPGRAGAGVAHPSGVLLENIQPAQFVGDVELVSSANNYLCWQGSWAPDAYLPRTIIFSLEPGSLGLPTYLAARDANAAYTLPIAGIVPDTRGSVTIQVVPCPPGVAALGGWALTMRRRRRAAHGGES